MAKRSGYANTNECQFYITTGAPLSALDNKNVVFGRVISGMRAIKMIDKLEVYNQKPTSIVQIKAAGIYNGN
jgi:cyclophilin family peptidyl-prolyl cis-trans isomerase